MVNTVALESGRRAPVLGFNRFILPKAFGKFSLTVEALSPAFLIKYVHFYYWVQKNQGDFFFKDEGEARSNKHILHIHM